ncbi:hypothetical protein [Agrobacterium genomosp. 13]|uniref:Uncharacterized protein n=1 Tax=Agrobacterium genomosp. 13 str. CFBP 6927 TaxID=1183428 RepID=A0ABP2BNC8_9HYPH|nr:hypothetical protein [Agrobacterium genomosp. 13]CUX58476.1 conserved hypothetical protein [Agrobacterium genomosp. 13 str. CFBP 6927]
MPNLDLTRTGRQEDIRGRNIHTVASASEGNISEHGNEDRFHVSFVGGPDEIYDQVKEWLEQRPGNLGDIVTVRKSGSLTFEDAPDGDWLGRYADVIWEETLPMWDLDGPDGEPMGAFDAEVLQRLIETHPQSFKALLADEGEKDEQHSPFLASFYCY